MNEASVRAKIKEVISNVTGIPEGDIGDHASYQEDLDLDSLSMLEIGVDVDYAFKLGLTEEAMQGVRTIDDAVALVLSHVAETAAHAEVA